MNVVPLAGLNVEDVLGAASGLSAKNSSIVDKFAGLMKASAALPVESDHSGIGAALVRQDESMRRNIQEVKDVAEAAANGEQSALNPARQIELTYQITAVQFQFNSSVYLAQASKNGLQTLMKNQ